MGAVADHQMNYAPGRFVAMRTRDARYDRTRDALAVHQAGYPAVVGLMGSSLSRYQADLLTTHFDRVVLMLDGDDAGRRGAMIIAQTLGAHMSVPAISLDDGRQPDQLTAEEVKRPLRQQPLTLPVGAR